MKSAKQKVEGRKPRAARQGLQVRADVEVKLGHAGMVLIAGGVAAILWAIARTWVAH